MYLALKLIHVAAVVLFLGNIVTGLFWKAHGDRSGSAPVIAHVFDGIIRSDRWFTIPGVAVIIISGVAMAFVARLSIFGTTWIWTSLILFAVSGLAYSFQVAPLQKRLRALAREADLDREAYRRLSLRWELWGLLALLTPAGAFALMVLKPTW